MRSRRASISNTPEKPTDDPIRWLLTVSGRGLGFDTASKPPRSSSVGGHRRFCFLLKRGPIDTGSCAANWEAFHNECSPRTLRNLESAGLIARRVTQSKAIAVEYSLTQLGRTIIAPLGGMFRWAKRYRRDESAGVRLREAE